MLLFVSAAAVTQECIFNTLTVWLVRTSSEILVHDIFCLSKGRAIPCNGYLTVLLCTVQLDSSLFTLFTLKFICQCSFYFLWPSEGRQESPESPCYKRMKAPCCILLAVCSFKQIQYHTVLRLQSKCFIISFSIPGPRGAFFLSLFTFVAVLCDGCQALVKQVRLVFSLVICFQL